LVNAYTIILVFAKLLLFESSERVRNEAGTFSGSGLALSTQIYDVIAMSNATLKIRLCALQITVKRCLFDCDYAVNLHCFAGCNHIVPCGKGLVALDYIDVRLYDKRLNIVQN